MIQLSDQERERFIAYLQQEINAMDAELLRRQLTLGHKVRWDSDLMLITSLKVTMKRLRYRPAITLQSQGIILRP